MFKSGKPVVDKDFIGREEELFRLKTAIEHSNSIVLIAPRRYGKTSLILEFKHQHKSNFIHIDFMNVYTKRELAQKIIEQSYKIAGFNSAVEQLKNQSINLLKNIINHFASLSISIDDIKIQTAQKLLNDKDDDELLEFALNLPQIMAEKLDKKIVFIIDELGEIVKFTKSNELLQKMRSIFQLQDKVTFIFAGSQYHLMKKLFSSSSSAFFRFATILHIEPMQIKDYSSFIISKFKEDDVVIAPSQIKLIQQITNGLPYYIMKIANEIYFYAKFKNKKINNISVLRVALSVYRSEKDFISLELSKIKGKKYFIEILKQIAHKQNPYPALESLGVKSQNINKIINELKDFGIVSKNEDGYYILDPFIKYYLQDKSG
jgi:AAA+ ATPase superfamily predicted ATPase